MINCPMEDREIGGLKEDRRDDEFWTKKRLNEGDTYAVSFASRFSVETSGAH